MLGFLFSAEIYIMSKLYEQQRKDLANRKIVEWHFISIGSFEPKNPYFQLLPIPANNKTDYDNVFLCVGVAVVLKCSSFPWITSSKTAIG